MPAKLFTVSASRDRHPKCAPTEQGRRPAGPERPTASPGRRASLLTVPPVLLLVLITWQVAVHGPLARADERLSGRVLRPDGVSQFLADLGSVPVAVPVLALVLVVVALRARRRGTARWWLPPLAAALLMAAVPLLVVPFKELVDRPGPPPMSPDTGFYPSGHTATAAVAYGGAVLVLWPWLRAVTARVTALALCAALNAGTGFGLVRHGYHWPLDVLASWCLCVVLLTGLAVFLASRGGAVRRE